MWSLPAKTQSRSPPPPPSPRWSTSPSPTGASQIFFLTFTTVKITEHVCRWKYLLLLFKAPVGTAAALCLWVNLIFSHLFLAIDGARATPVNLLTCHIPPSKASAPRPAPKLVPRVPPTNGAPPLLSPSNTPAAENQFARAAYLRNHLAHSTILNPSDTYHLGSKCMLSGGPRLKCVTIYISFISRYLCTLRHVVCWAIEQCN